MVIRIRQISERFKDEKSYRHFYFRSLDFKIWSGLLILIYLFILGAVLGSVYARGDLIAESRSLIIFFSLLLLLILYLIFLSPFRNIKASWSKYYEFCDDEVRVIKINEGVHEVIRYVDIYSLSYTESMDVLTLFYKTNNFRINKVVGLIGVNKEDFLEAVKLIKNRNNNIIVANRKNAFF